MIDDERIDWNALDAALCERFDIEPSRQLLELMKVLKKAAHGFTLSFYAGSFSARIYGPERSGESADLSTPEQALALAAANYFNIPVPEQRSAHG